MFPKAAYPKSTKTYHIHYDKNTKAQKAQLVGKNGGDVGTSRRDSRGQRIPEWEMEKISTYAWKMRRGGSDDQVSEEVQKITQSWIRNQFQLNADGDSMAKKSFPGSNTWVISPRKWEWRGKGPEIELYDCQNKIKLATLSVQVIIGYGTLLTKMTVYGVEEALMESIMVWTFVRHLCFIKDNGMLLNASRRAQSRRGGGGYDAGGSFGDYYGGDGGSGGDGGGGGGGDGGGS